MNLNHLSVNRAARARRIGLARLLTVLAGIFLFNATTIFGQSFLESAGQVVMEAENFTDRFAGTGSAAGKTWNAGFMTSASGGRKIQAGTNTGGGNTGDALNGPRVNYRVKFTTVGTYYVWVRLWGEGLGNDSIHVGLDGTPYSLGSHGLSSGIAGLWAWSSTKDDGTVVSVNVTTPGYADVNIWLREDGVVVDKIILTQSASFIPTDTGPVESAREAALLPQSYSARGDFAPSEVIAKLFDGQSSTKWLDKSPTTWVQVSFASPTVLDAYSITSAGPPSARYPASWTLSGSYDNVNWTVIDGRNGQSAPGGSITNVFTVAVPLAAYTQFRFDFQATSGTMTQLAELTLFGSSSGVVVAPTITLQPASMGSVLSGEAASFSVTASGLNLSYQWYRNGVALSGATASTYSIASTNGGDSGSYSVVVSNSAGSVASSSAVLTVVTVGGALSPQSFSARGDNANGTYGNEGIAQLFDGQTSTKWLDFSGSTWVQVSFASPTALASYKITSADDAPGRDPISWTLSGSSDGVTWTVIETRSGQSWSSRFLTRDFILASPSGAYTQFRFDFQATSGTITQLAELAMFGSAGTTVVPSITTQPASQTVAPGQNVSFAVVASGTAPLSYQWKKNGTNISGAIGATYTIASAASADAANYVVLVSNSAGSVISNAAVLTVNTPSNQLPVVTLTAPAANASFTLPTSVTLTATASDPDGSISKVEFFNGDRKLGETATSPYTLAWTPTAPGHATLFARVTDNLGAIGKSLYVSVTLSLGLPYTADFELSEGYWLGSLNNQRGWNVTAGSAQVVNTTSAHGTQSVVFNPGSAAAVVDQEFGFMGTNPSIVFVDFSAKPVAGVDTNTGTLFDIDAARIACVLNGSSGRLVALDGDGLGAGVWKTLPPVLALSAGNVASAWQRLSVRLNYTAKTYDLYLNGQMIAADLKFRFSAATYVSWFSIKGHTDASASLDDLYAGPSNPLFADTNNNGLDDAWETAHGLSLSSDNRSADADGDGLTNLEEYQSGSDPLDYFNGSVPVITSLVDPSGQLGAQGLVSVKVTRSSDGSVLINAPVTLTVSAGASQISSTVGGTLGNSVAIRTNASGVATGYVTFTSQNADTLVASVQSGGQSVSLSIGITGATPVLSLKEMLEVLAKAPPGSSVPIGGDPEAELSDPVFELQYGGILIAGAAKAKEKGNLQRISELISVAKIKLSFAQSGGLTASQSSHCHYLLGLIAERYEGRLPDAATCYQNALTYDFQNRRAKAALVRVQTILQSN